MCVLRDRTHAVQYQPGSAPHPVHWSTPAPPPPTTHNPSPLLPKQLDESAASASGGAPNAVDDNVEGQISVYEAPSMELLDRKSIRAEGAFAFVPFVV